MIHISVPFPSRPVLWPALLSAISIPSQLRALFTGRWAGCLSCDGFPAGQRPGLMTCKLLNPLNVKSQAKKQQSFPSLRVRAGFLITFKTDTPPKSPVSLIWLRPIHSVALSPAILSKHYSLLMDGSTKGLWIKSLSALSFIVILKRRLAFDCILILLYRDEVH